MRKLLSGVRPHISRRTALRHGLPTAVLMVVGALVVVFAQVGGTPTAAQRDGSGYSGDCAATTTATIFQGELAGMALGNSHKTTTVTKWKTATKTVTKTKTVTTTKVKPICRTVTGPGQTVTTTANETHTITAPGDTVTTTANETHTITAPGETVTTTITGLGTTSVTTTTVTVTELPITTVTSVSNP